MTQQEVLPLIAKTINGYRHNNYDRTVSLYNQYLALSTGEGIDEYLQRFSSRESAEAFEERKNVTVDISKSITKNLCHVFYRVTRTPGVRIEHEVDSAKQSDYSNILSSFGRYGVAGYMERRATDLIKIDPNAWLVVDFEGTDGNSYARPYPIEFYSPDVMDYSYYLSQLKYVIVRQAAKREGVDGKIFDVYDYSCYTSDGAVKLIAQPDLDDAQPFVAGTEYMSGELVGFNKRTEKIDGKDKEVCDVYMIYIPSPYMLGEVPAFNVGYIPDELTRGETFVNFFDNAVPYQLKLIKTNSESDISACKHAFAQKLQFVRECPNNCEQDSDGQYCVNGCACTTCGGKGYIEMHTSGLDCITIPLNDDNKDLQLDNLVKYVQTPVDTLRYQDEKVQSLIEMCKRVIYNSDIISKGEITDTAYQSMIESQNVLDTIYTYAVHYASMYSWVLSMIGKITGIDVTVNVNVSKDMSLMTRDELISLASAAKTAGLNPLLIKVINDEIAYALLGNTDKYKRYIASDEVIPFNEMSGEEKMLVLQFLPKDNAYRIRAIFGNEILKQLEAEHEAFYEFTDAKKNELIAAKVAEIALQIEAESETIEEPEF